MTEGRTSNRLSVASAIGAGLLFGIGLVVSGMADPTNVRSFLDVGGHWNPSLMFVMIGAIAVAMPGFAFVKRLRDHVRSSQIVYSPFNRTHAAIDQSLVYGSVIFGLGWGLSGFCPGPALLAVFAPSIKGAAFVTALLVGVLVHRFINRD